MAVDDWPSVASSQMDKELFKGIASEDHEGDRCQTGDWNEGVAAERVPSADLRCRRGAVLAVGLHIPAVGLLLGGTHAHPLQRLGCRLPWGVFNVPNHQDPQPKVPPWSLYQSQYH